MNKNKFVVVEGVDGTGKTSIAKALAEKMDGFYYHSPSKKIEFLHRLANASPAILRYWYFSLGNFISSREFKKLLKRQSVIVDKYIYSTAAFHSIMLNKSLRLQKHLLLPDLIIYVHADFNVVDKRINSRPSRSKYEELEFLKAVSKKYDQLLESSKNVIRIDTTNKTVEQSVLEINAKIL
jgi:thymidylate kinase